jgi:hypothetical protein
VDRPGAFSRSVDTLYAGQRSKHHRCKKVYKWFVADDAKSGEKLALAKRHLKRVLSA